MADDEAISFLDCFAFATLGLAMTRLVEVLLELNCYSSSEVEKFSTRPAATTMAGLARTILEQMSARTVLAPAFGLLAMTLIWTVMARQIKLDFQVIIAKEQETAFERCLI